MSNTIRFLPLVFALLFRTDEPPQATFQPLGDLVESSERSEAFGVTEDGRIVFGERAGAEGFIWSEKSGVRVLGGGQTQPRGASRDGRTLVGHAIGASGMPLATLWSGADATPRSLGDLAGGMESSGALAVSADGKLVAGWGSSETGLEPVQWKNGGPPEALEDLPGGALHGAVAAISRDGKTLVGTGTTEEGQEMALWTGDGVRGLGDLEGGEHRSEPFAITPDVRVIVGRGSSARGMEAVRWTEAGGFTALGDLEGGAVESYALGVSADGAVVVGAGTSASGQEAFVWTESGGMKSLRAVLVEAGVTGLEGWQLTVVNGISGDGRVLVGGGVNPQGNPEGWIVRFATRPE